jgi:ABC-type bacteriocin/lantibiotic exporter with double-glycine peptidase domain
MKTFLLLLLVILLAGCTKPIGCGQNVLSIYSNVATSNGTRLNDINSMLLNHKTSMFELKQAANKLGFECLPMLYSSISEFKEYTGYAIVLLHPEKLVGHYIIVRVEDRKVYQVFNNKEEAPFDKFTKSKGVALLLS